MPNKLAAHEIDWSERWDDLRFPAQGINPSGPASPPDIDPDDGTLLFSGVADESVIIIAQMPHCWKEGSGIRPHVHWSKSTDSAEFVAWLCEYSMANPGETFPAFQTLALSTDVADGTPDGAVANQHLITTFGELDMTGMDVSCIIKFRLTRDISEDSYLADAKLLEFDIHYRVDSAGSAHEFIKHPVAGREY